MSLKALSLGSVAAAANGITISAGTNATPIVATVGAGHGLKNGDRIIVSGVTGNTNMNGEWTLSSVGATVANLTSSVGNGAFGGTAAVAVICDTTPHMKGHDAVIQLDDSTLVGTVVIEGSSDNVTFADVKKGVALGANPGTDTFEVTMLRYMRLRCSAFTSGASKARILA